MTQPDSNEETEELIECADCGALIADGGDASFPYGEGGVLCFECAIRRGGQYDADADRWTVPPELSDLEPAPLDT
ncbi:MAG TPA: hypothetical protein VHE30_02215 [Polyangiaceae bacterium]|nr:hypothetical protein [Polyangiaceae bacterium]